MPVDMSEGDVLVAPTIPAYRLDPGDEQRYSHIVGPAVDEDGNRTSGHVRVMQARLNGTPVTALCGYTWVPTRDARQFPLCSYCEAIAKANGNDVPTPD